MNRFWKFSFLLLVSLLVASGSVYAKFIPFLEETEWGDTSAAVEMPESLPFHRLYGHLGECGDIDAFAYTFEKPLLDWTLTVAVPECGDHFTAVKPSVAVIGTGLDTPDKALPFDLPEDTGAVLLDDSSAQSVTHYFDQEAVQYGFRQQIDIPQADVYTLVVWEPNGHVGAYSLEVGNIHPDSMMGVEDIESKFDKIFSGEWMNQDCDAPVTVEDCPATASEVANPNRPAEEPERSIVGEGYSLTGMVRDAETCLPLAGVNVSFWMANPEGEYDDDHTGRLTTNQQGMYRIQSDKPGSYGPDAHIHFYFSADGYEPIETTFILAENEDENAGRFDIAIVPQK